MNILIIGYGKMGRSIEKVALERGHTVAAKVNTPDELKALPESIADVALEFTSPEAAFENITTALNKGIPVVSGTTGWLHQKNSVEKLCQDKKGGFFYASNFSIGVNLFFRINCLLAELMAPHSDTYQPSLSEIHHTEKKDAPSGTAITLAEGLIENHPSLNSWKLIEDDDSTVKMQPGELPVSAFRRENVVGDHSITYTSEMDFIRIEHSALQRKSFALGAVKAAEWLQGKQGVFSMQDMLQL